MAALIRQRWYLLLAAAVGLAVLAGLGRSPLAGPADDTLTVAVSEGPFELQVSGTAVLDARQSVTLSSELPSNSGKLIWLVPDGALVKRGDIVARFDPAAFEAEVRDLERDLADAQAALMQAEAELQLQVQVGREGQAAADQAITSSSLRLKSLSDADRPLRLAQARNDVLAARTAAARAAEEHAAQQEMFEGGFGSRAMVDEAAAAEAEAGSQLALAQRALEVLEKVSLPGEIQQARLELESKQRERRYLEQANLQSLAKQNALLLRARSAVDELAGSVAAARARLALTSLAAPVPGFVVYKKVSVNGETRKVQIGDSVWNRHGFMVIPDMSALVATLNVPEQDVGRVAPGQPARLRPAAYPDLELAGSVESVGALAADGAEGNLFQVRLAVRGADARLRPGMRAEASVVTGRHEDVLRAPVEAVFFDRGEALCFVWSWGAPRRQRVVLGDSDGQYVIVREGLDRGDRLLLTWPAAMAAAAD
jgi:multidrug resistance efflux pump